MLIEAKQNLQRVDECQSYQKKSENSRQINQQLDLLSAKRGDQNSDKQKKIYLNIIALNDHIDSIRSNYLNRKTLINSSFDALTTYNHKNQSFKKSSFQNPDIRKNISIIQYSKDLNETQSRQIQAQQQKNKKVFDTLTKKLDLFQRSIVSQRDKSIKMEQRPKLIKPKQIDSLKDHNLYENRNLKTEYFKYQNTNEIQDRQDFTVDLQEEMIVMRGIGNHDFEDPFVNIKISFV